MAISRPKQVSNQNVSALHVDSSVTALVVHSVDASGAYVSPGAGSTQVSIKEILTSSGASVMDSTLNAIGVTIRGGAASGTEYTDGDVDATPNGGVIFFNNSSNTMRAVSAATPLPVSGTFSASTTVNVSSLAGAVICRSSAADMLVTATLAAGGVVRSTNSVAADLQATVTPVAGSTWNVRPIQSSAADLQMTATPLAGSTWNVRPLQSSAADLQATVTPAAGSTWAVRPLQSSQGDLRVTAYQSSRAEFLATVYQSSRAELLATVYQSSASEFLVTATIGGNLQSTVAPSSGSSGLVVRPVIDSLLTVASSNAFASTTLVISQNVAGQRCKVYAYSITSTVQTPTALKFYGGSSMIWPVILAAISSAVTGANLAVSPPAYLFASDANSSLSIRVASSVAGFKLGVSYFMAP